MEKRDRKDELLLLMAVSGEIPADWMGRAAGSESYGASLLTRLKRDGEIKLRSKDGIRGYLLRARTKQYLLEHYGEDTKRYLTGESATNHVKSEPEKRLRLHRMSMVWIFLYRVGISIFVSDKRPFYSEPDGKDMGRPLSAWNGAYYGTAEWKTEQDKEISGSRACGILKADESFLVYNSMDSLMKWTPKIERNLRGRMELRFWKQGTGVLRGAILFGTDMELLHRILNSDGGIKGNLYRIDDVYEEIYYIPFLSEAALQIHLLCSLQGREKFHRFLCSALAQVKKDEFHLEEGRDFNGNPVYFCYLLELWKLKRIREQRRSGRVFCFHYQAPVLSEILGNAYTIEAIRPEKAYQYLGWKGREERGHGINL